MRALKHRAIQHGITAGIIAVGTIVAAETATHSTSFLPKTKLAQRVAVAVPASTVPALGTPATPVANTIGHALALDDVADHPRVQFWIDRLTTTFKHSFEQSLVRKDKYDDMIVAKLDAKQMPRDLVYLAMIESEFNPNAKSPVHAVGLWQFMSGTARRFGLAVGKHVDERRDPARATDAAVKYLSSLHDRFGSWYLAAAAYNSGEGTVQRAMKKLVGRTTGTDADFFRILPALPRETQDYVPKLIAASLVGNNPEKYGLTSGDVTAPVLTQVAEKTPAAKSAEKARARVVHKASKHKTVPKARAKRSTHVRQHSKHTTRHR